MTTAEEEALSDFFGNLGMMLRGKEGVDIGLADILAEHLLVAAPTVDAVAISKAAILKLASERANPSNPEMVSG